MMSSSSFFVHRLELSQVSLHNRLESVCIQTRVSNSHESTTPGVPNWLCGRGDLFSGFLALQQENSSFADAKIPSFFWSSPGFSGKIIRLSASGSSRDSSPSRNGRVSIITKVEYRVEFKLFFATTQVKSFFVATRFESLTTSLSNIASF